MSDWTYENNLFTEDMVGDHVGFVYEITNLLTGKKYIGKKLFKFTRTKKPLKGKTRKRRSKVASDWMTYFGSNDLLKEEVVLVGKDNFSRKILYLCDSKGVANYLELKEIIDRDALRRDDYYNEWITCKIHRSQLKLL